MNDTVKLDEPKFIRYENICFYCFGNCELCNIRFMCWAGQIELETPAGNIDEFIEKKAFGNNLGRIIMYAHINLDRFFRIPYYGKQVNKPVFAESKLLYLNDKNMVCCRKKAKPIHHVKNWNG